MSIEKLEFMLPTTFTIGPRNDTEALHKYAKLLSVAADGQERNQLQDIVRGVIEGETRVIAAQLSIEQIFQERRQFKVQYFDEPHEIGFAH